MEELEKMKMWNYVGVCATVALSTTMLGAAPKFEPTCASPAAFAPGVEEVSTISELRKAGKRAEAEAALKALQGPGQLKDMALFALERDDKSKTAEMTALLKKVVAENETSFWGTAAMGLLHMRGEAPISLYWPWKKGDLVSPETTITYGVDKKFAEPGRYTLSVKGPAKIAAIELLSASGVFAHLTAPFAFDLPKGVKLEAVKLFVETPEAGELVITRQVLKPRGAASFGGLKRSEYPVAAYIREVVGEDAIAEIGAREGGAAFLARFFADIDWMRQFAGSGPWSCQPWQGVDENRANAAKALKALDLLVWNDDGSIFSSRAARNLATALALNHGYDQTDEWLVRVYALYRGWLKDGSLIAEAQRYDVREWREVVGFGQNQWLTPEDYLWSHNFVKTVSPEDCGALCWQCSYRTFNCFGDSIHGPDYYKPWEHRLVQQESRYYVGGVCGSLSKFGSLVAATHGVRGFTAGQPAHCAYMLWDYAKNRWNIAYSVTGHTGPHNSLGGGNFASACEQQLYYAHPDRIEAERLRWQGKYEESMRRVAGNWCAAVGWFNALERAKAPIEAYEPYAKAVLETFAEMPAQGFQLYLPYLNKLPTRDAKLAAACAAVKALRESPEEFVETAYLEDIVFNPMKQIFRGDNEALWTLFEAVLDGQASTKTFYRQAVNWGAANLIADEKTTKRFLRVVAASVEKTKSVIDYREMILTASKNGDIEMFRQVYDLMDKCSPELKAKRQPKVWPKEKLGGQLLSSDGVLMISTTSPWDWPLSYRDALAAEDYVEGNAFHTAREAAPWGMVKLPGPAEVTAITVVNSGAGGNRSRQIPLSIWTSEDGKTFTLLSSFTKVQDEWSVELLKPIKARFIKVGRTPNDRTDVFHLHKILVYGKKLY